MARKPQPISAICIGLNPIIDVDLSCNNTQLTQVIGRKNEIYTTPFKGLRQFKNAIETVLRDFRWGTITIKHILGKAHDEASQHIGRLNPWRSS